MYLLGMQPCNNAKSYESTLFTPAFVDYLQKEESLNLHLFLSSAFLNHVVHFFSQSGRMFSNFFSLASTICWEWKEEQIYISVIE